MAVVAPESVVGLGPTLAVELAPSHERGLRLSSPVLGAPICDENGQSVEGSLTDCGAIVTKTVTLKRRAGNSEPVMVRMPYGWLNSMGLPNPGAEEFVRDQAPNWAAMPCPVIVSIAAPEFHDAEKLLEDWGQLAARFESLENVVAIEANLSCPNVKGGLDASIDPNLTYSVVRVVRQNTSLPVIAKLSPNVTDLRPIAKSAEAAGAHALSLINTVRGLEIDPETAKPNLGAVIGGLSGPAIRPIALRCVYEVSGVVSIPVIGMGGVVTTDDALQFLMAGASAVQVGTARIKDHRAIERIVAGLRGELASRALGSVEDLVGMTRRYWVSD